MRINKFWYIDFNEIKLKGLIFSNFILQIPMFHCYNMWTERAASKQTL